MSPPSEYWRRQASLGRQLVARDEDDVRNFFDNEVPDIGLLYPDGWPAGTLTLRTSNGIDIRSWVLRPDGTVAAA